MLGAMGAAVGVYYFSADYWLGAVGGLAFAALAWRRLDLALLAVVFTIPFYRFPRHFGSMAFSLSEFGVLATFLVWSLRQAWLWMRRETSLLQLLQPLAHPWSATLFLCAATVSLFFTDGEYLRFSLREYRTIVVEPWLFFIMLITTMRGRRDAGRLVAAFVLLSTGVAAYTIYHYYFIGIVEATEGVKRALAVYHSPNALGLFLGRGLPMAIALTLFLRTEGMARVLKLLCGLAVVLIGAGIFLTYSRGAWLGVAASVFFIAAVKGRRIFIAAVGAVAALAVMAVPFVDAGRLISSGTNFLRLSLWQSAVNMIRDHPVFGVGLDNFLYYYRDRGYMLPDAWQEPEISHPHNLILDYWTRLGLLGLASLLALQVTFWRAAWSAYRRLGDGPTQVVVLALMASMVDFVVHGLVDNSYFLIDLAMVFWLTLGAVEIIAQEGK